MTKNGACKMEDARGARSGSRGSIASGHYCPSLSRMAPMHLKVRGRGARGPNRLFGGPQCIGASHPRPPPSRKPPTCTAAAAPPAPKRPPTHDVEWQRVDPLPPLATLCISPN